eukprot:15055155-Ditylum_brightwellii.AAC.1
MGGQQYVTIFSSACKLKATGRQPLKHSMEELVKYLKGVKCSETKNPPKRNNWSNKSTGLKKTEKSKRNHDKDKKSHDITDNSASYKKSRKQYELCKMFGVNAELHTTDCCNKKNLLSGLLDRHKKKHMERANKEEFCAMVKAFKKASGKGKK